MSNLGKGSEVNCRAGSSQAILVKKTKHEMLYGVLWKGERVVLRLLVRRKCGGNINVKWDFVPLVCFLVCGVHLLFCVPTDSCTKPTFLPSAFLE